MHNPIPVGTPITRLRCSSSHEGVEVGVIVGTELIVLLIVIEGAALRRGNEHVQLHILLQFT